MAKTKAKNHTDIKSDGWIGRYLPAGLWPYALLMRLDRPIGTWLLLLPAWAAIMLAAGGGPGINEFVFMRWVLFGIGAVIMRGAGCVVNDLWDRKLDKSVERTQNRPLAAGTVRVWQALALVALLLVLGLGILLQMSLVAVLLGFMAVPLIVLYPLMKRWTWWPQAFLGVTFNFGALMGWAAINGVLSLPALLLYIGGFFWTLGYDTIYAHQDKEDDMKVGIKSTALLFGENSRNYVTVFYTAAMIFVFAAFIAAHAGAVSLALLLLPAAQLVWQVRSWKPDDQDCSLKVFRSNRDFGLLVVLAAIF